MSLSDSISEEAVRERAKQDGVTHISTGVAVVRGGRILLIRRVQGDFLGGNFELPGGGVDEGETITASALRELKEETGLTASEVVTTFDGFDYATDKKSHVRQINCIVTAEPDKVVLDPKEHDDFVWANEDNLADIRMSENMRHCAKNALRIIRQLP